MVLAGGISGGLVAGIGASADGGDFGVGDKGPRSISYPTCNRGVGRLCGNKGVPTGTVAGALERCCRRAHVLVNRMSEDIVLVAVIAQENYQSTNKQYLQGFQTGNHSKIRSHEEGRTDDGYLWRWAWC